MALRVDFPPTLYIQWNAQGSKAPLPPPKAKGGGEFFAQSRKAAKGAAEQGGTYATPISNQQSAITN